jgi:type I restriction enzyme S subunit
VIEKTQAQIDKLKDLQTGMMQELLTKGIGHTEFKDSTVGMIPAEWKIVPISELCSDVVDCMNKTAQVVDYKTPFKMIRTTNVRHGRVDTENVRYVAQETYETWTRRMRPENGDLIFTREAPVGECGVLEDSRGVFLGQRTMMYRANEQLTSLRFLMYSLMSNYGKQQLDDFSGGSTVAHMRVPDCNKILIKTPPIEEKNKIVNSINSIDVSIQKKESKLEKIINTKKALMQDLLTGKVRVNTAQATSKVAMV